MQNRDRINKALAARFVNYQNLISIPIIENSDPMRDVADFSLSADLAASALPSSTGSVLVLRQSVCERLLRAQEILQVDKPGYKLVLTYAYRSMEIQCASFEKMKRELGLGDRTDPEAMERTHHFIAVPEVAGHPTGGAVDLMIVDADGNALDFGTGMHALEQDSYFFSPFISDAATNNRKLLRRVMQAADFAPYDGEWWHYSYGDREWAAYYGEPLAFYSQLPESAVAGFYSSAAVNVA
ncbi:MAG: D-alanyl-D-alanine carboxypeptidase family protein [Alphaproteobacteria bacterium]|nr:D-alanyl-D-alanine carboxypeptidase family protein [Alphaproteobacteria bacterium]